MKIEDVAAIAVYSGEIEKNECRNEELLKALEEKGYLPSLVEAFTNAIDGLSVKPKTLSMLRGKRDRMLGELRKKHEVAKAHKFYEKEDCIIHEWQSPLNGRIYGVNIIYKELFGNS